MPVITKCAFCSKEISIKPCLLKEFNYCSQICVNAHKVKKNCLICGCEIDVIFKDRDVLKYCRKCVKKSGPNSKNCELCGKLFYYKSDRKETAKFCSFACSMGTKRRNFICKQCGKESEVPLSYNVEFCSPKCVTDSLKNREELVCKQCGVIYDIKKSHASDSNFCSQACQYEFRSDEIRASYKEPDPIEGAKWINLGHGKFALVDEDDFAELNSYKWQFHKGYAVRFDGEHHSMHRQILNPPLTMEVDHINGNRTDNRRSNLRIANASLNAMNKHNTGGSSSGYRGVYYYESSIRSFITFEYKQMYLGTFKTEREAALAYDAAARKLFGSYARLNFPTEKEQQAAFNLKAVKH